MSNRKSYFNGELGQRFGYRKLTIGLCSVVLGSFLLTTNNQQVKADTTSDGGQTEKATTNADSSTQPEAKQANVVKETAPQTTSNSASSTVNTSSDANKVASVNDTTIDNQDPSISNNNQTQNATQTNQQSNTVEQNVQANATRNGVATTKQASQGPTPNVGDKSAQSSTQVNKQETNTNSVQQNNGNSIQNGTTTGKTNNLDVTKNNNPIFRANVLAYSKIADVQSEDNNYSKSTVEPITKGNKTYTGIRIDNPRDGIVHIHFIDQETNKEIGTGYDIPINKALIDKYKNVPAGYILNNPDGSFSVVNNGVLNSKNLKATVERYDDASVITPVVPGEKTPVVDPSHLTETEKDQVKTNVTNVNETVFPAGTQIIVGDDGTTTVTYPDYSKDTIPGDILVYEEIEDVNPIIPTVSEVEVPVTGSNHLTENEIETHTAIDSPVYGKQHLPVAFADSKGNIIGQVKWYSGEIGDKQNVSLTLPTGYKLADGQTLPTSVTFANSTAPTIITVEPNGQMQEVDSPTDNTIHVKFVDQLTGNEVKGGYDINLDNQSNGQLPINAPSGYSSNATNLNITVSSKIQYGNNSYIHVVNKSDNLGDKAGTVPITWSQASLNYFASVNADLNHNTDSLRAGFNTHLPYDDWTQYEVTGVKFIVVAQDQVGLDGTHHEEGAPSSVYQDIRNAIKAKWSHMDINDTNDLFVEGVLDINGKNNKTVSTINSISNNTVIVPVYKSTTYSFIDNSNNVASISDNNVNVSIIKAGDRQHLAIDFVDASNIQGKAPQVGDAVFRVGNVGDTGTFTLTSDKTATGDNNIIIPDGYILDQEQGDSKGITINKDGTATVKVTYANSTDPFLVRLIHATQEVGPGTTILPEGVSQNDVRRDITRTINVTTKDKDGKVTNTATPVVQHIIFTRTGTYDNVSKKVTHWNDWTYDGADSSSTNKTTPQFDAYTLPSIPKGQYAYLDGQEGKSITVIPVQTQDPDAKTQSKDITVDTKNSTVNVIIAPDITTPINDNDPTYAQNNQKKFTRTITVVSPDGTNTIIQEIDVHRSGIKDNITGNITWNPWTVKGGQHNTGMTFDEYDVPVISGYTPNVSKVDAKTINPDDDPASLATPVNVTYTANQQNGTYYFVDDDNKGIAVGTTGAFSGKTDQSVTVPYDLAKLGDDASDYEVVGNTTYTFKRTDNNPQVAIHLKHKTQASNDANVDRSTATRTINITINKPASAGGPVTHTIKQVIGLKRSWTEDMVTKIKTYGDWSVDDGHCEFDKDDVKQNDPAPKAYIISGGKIYFASVNLPDVPGYTPENPQVEQSKDSIAELTLPYMTMMSFMFMPSTQHVTYHFLDQDNNNAQVGTITEDGVTDDTKQFTLTAPDGYDFATASDANQKHKFTAGDSSVININVIHHIISGITSGQYGTQDSDFSRTIKRTLNVTSPDNQTRQEVQSHTFTRTADYDAADKQIIWHPWSDGGKFTFTTPDDIKPVDGYNLTNIPDEDITPDTGDTSLDVHYEPVEQHVTINYVDDQGKTIKSTIEKGGTGSKIDLSRDMPENWKISDGKQDMNYTFTSANSQDVTVKIGHILDAKDPENKTITRKVTIYLPDGTIDQQHSTTQSATFTRTVDFDRVLGRDVYGAWSTPQTFDAITGLKNYEGFDTPSVPTVTVTGDSSSSTLDLHYKARGQNITIYYNDADTGKTITSSTLNGKTNQTIDIAYKAPDHWHITNQKDLPTSHKFTAKDDLTIIAKIAHDLTANGTDSKTISRHIEIDVPGGDPKTVDQTVTFTRPKYTDDVDGKTVYGDWSESGKHTFDAVNVPNVPGYAANGSAPAIVVTPDSKDPDGHVKITYIAGGQTGSYRFVDDDEQGAQVGKDYQIAGKTGDTIKLDYTVPDGYQLDNSFTIPGSYTFNDGTNAPAIIHLKHALVDATNDPNAETSRTFNRNIMITNPDGKGMNAQQSVTFIRKAQKDAVTGKYVYGSWSNGGIGKFDEYDIKPQAGYTIIDLDTGKEITSIPALDINADKTPQATDMKIGYKAQEQKAYWYFVDDDVKQSTDAVKALEARHEIDGKTGESVPLNIQLPANYHVVSVGYADADGLAIQLDAVNGNDNKDVKIPTEYTFAGTGNKTLVIHLGHNKAEVSSAKDGNGVDDSRTITRTIILSNPDGKETTEKQTVTFTRTASKDLVDGTITYGDWSNGGKQTMPALKVPAVPGYSSDQKGEEIPAIVVTPDSKPSSIMVHYNANDGQQTIVYVGSNGKELGKQIVKGKTDEEVPFTPEFPAGYTNKEVPNTIKIPAVDKPLTMTVEPKVTTVHIDPNHPIEEGQTIPGTDIKAPKGLGKDDLNKDITRHVVISLPDGSNKTIDQTVHAQRGATIDLNTKKITYDPWKVVGKDSFDPIKVPTVDGYTPSVSEIPGVKHVDPNKDYGNVLNVTVTYTKNKAEKKNVGNKGSNNGDYIDNGGNNNVVANTDSTLSDDGKLRGLNTDGMKNNTVDVKAGKGNIKRHESTKLSKALLKNDERNGNKRGKNYGSRGRYVRGYGYGANGAGYGANNNNGYSSNGYDNGMNSNGYGIGANVMSASVNSAENSNMNTNGAMSGVDSAASGQYSSLPQTGSTQNYAVLALGLATISLSFGLAGTRRKRS